MLDISSKKVMDLKYTELYYPDHWIASDLLKDNYGKIGTLYADGVYA